MAVLRAGFCRGFVDVTPELESAMETMTGCFYAERTDTTGRSASGRLTSPGDQGAASIAAGAR